MFAVDRTAEMMAHRQDTSIHAVTVTLSERQRELVEPRKVAHPILDSSTQRRLLRELLLTHKRGLLPGERSELQKVLEQRMEKNRKQTQPVSDLEAELRKHKDRLLAYELEETRHTENQRNLPEFMRVRENLRRIQVSGH